MAIFASTTTSGYSDPLKAYSIKALEMRQQEMQAQQAKAEAAMFTPENTQTPIQGFGQLANVAADKINQSRLDSTAAANRAELSSLIAGTKPGEDLSPQAQARMAVLAPDMYKEAVSAIAERRKQEALFGQQDKARAADAEIARQAKIDEEQRIANRPASDAAKIVQDVQSGKITPKLGEELTKKLTQGSTSEQKYVTGLQEQSVAGQSLLASLDEALALTNHPKGIHAGGGAGMVQGIGEGTPKILQGITSAAGIDPETVSNTQRYNQIMGEQALELLNKMKGASSDRDVAVNFKIVNDPSATIENKRKAIGRMKERITTLIQLHNDAITEANGKVPTLATAGSGAATPPAPGGGAAASVPRPAGKNDSDLIAEANAAIAAHPEKKAEIEAQLQKWMMGP